MARYNESEKIYADVINDKNRLKGQIAGPTTTLFISKRRIENMTLSEDNVVVTSRDRTGDTMWGLFNWGAANWEADDSSPTRTEVIRRKWEYYTSTQLNTGSKSKNIKTNNNDLRLRR